MIPPTLRQTLFAFAGFGLIVVFAVLMIGCCGEIEARSAELEQLNIVRVSEIRGLRTKVASMEELQQQLAATRSKLDSTKGRIDDLEAREELADSRLQTLKELLDKLKGVIESGDLSVRIKRGRMVLELPSAILFKSGEADLSDKGKETLDKVATVLVEIKDREFQVAGHTDNVPLGKENQFGSNWHLSAARAVSVVQYLVEQGVSPKNLSAAGYSRYRPVASNKGARGKARNRRISIALMPNLKELPDLTTLETEFGLREPEVGY